LHVSLAAGLRVSELTGLLLSDLALQPVPTIRITGKGRKQRAGFAFVLKKYAQTAAEYCISLRDKQVSPHVLRHTCAMVLFQATKDLRKVSLWLGHAQMQTTEVYLRADPMEKIETIEGMTPLRLKRGRFTVPDKLIASLQTH